MGKYKIFVDGSSGTTGLRIADRLAERDEFEILKISEADRKDVRARAAVINESDLSVRCLPDDAAREVVPLLRDDVRILDTSTAHRTAPGWVYGLPELHGTREVLKTAEFPPMVPQYINNHIHTTYSFSPYSPTAAVFAARMEGLCTAGIIDHDSISGAREFLEAAKLVEMPVTVGMECRASMDGTRLEGRRTNNPDQVGVSYMTIQSVPHDKIETLNAWFAPYRAARGRRNRAMVEKINALLDGIALDYDRDVLPLSEAKEDGGVTERHLMYALAKKMVVKAGKGQPMVDYLASIGLNLSEKQKNQMLDTAYPFYDYDLLGILKSAFVPKIYIDATEECPNVRDVAKLCNDIDALLCYAYLGDVTASVTGDKKAQKFEDDYLDDVIACIKDCGIRAVTYMPTRNTPEQLTRLRRLCDENGLFQVSGEDINSPRQSFVIKAMENPLFSNLIDATWKLIEHEKTGSAIC